MQDCNEHLRKPAFSPDSGVPDPSPARWKEGKISDTNGDINISQHPCPCGTHTFYPNLCRGYTYTKGVNFLIEKWGGA